MREDPHLVDLWLSGSWCGSRCCAIIEPQLAIKPLFGPTTRPILLHDRKFLRIQHDLLYELPEPHEHYLALTADGLIENDNVVRIEAGKCSLTTSKHALK